MRIEHIELAIKALKKERNTIRVRANGAKEPKAVERLTAEVAEYDRAIESFETERQHRLDAENWLDAKS